MASADNDWSLLDTIAMRHGVLPLLYAAVQSAPDSVPPAAAARIRRQHQENASHSLLLAGRLTQVLGVLASNGIQTIALKGPILAEHYYGDITSRQFCDLDILVRRENLLRLSQILHAHGFQPVDRFSPRQWAAHLRSDCEFVFHFPDGSLHLDVHWSLTLPHEGGGVGTEELFHRSQSCLLGGRPVLILSPNDTLLHLCLHGTRNLWTQLRFLFDLRAVLGSQGGWDWPQLLFQARRSGLVRSLLLGLTLVHDVLGTELSPLIQEAAGWDKGLAGLRTRLRSNLLENWDGGSDETSPSSTLLTIALHPTFRERVTFPIGRLFLPTRNDYRAVRLPDPAYPLYFVLRPARLAFILARRCLAGLRYR